jgi:hypothetical protein
MDEHAERVCRPLMDAWSDFGRGQATLLDQARLAAQASNALDNASAPLPQLLGTAASDLEYAYYASESAEHAEAAQRILGPVLAQMGVAR